MKIKKDAKTFSTDDLLYSLFTSNNLSPEKYLKKDKDVEKVREAMSVIVTYFATLIKAGLVEEI